MIIIGIDPGASGGIAVLRRTSWDLQAPVEAFAVKMPDGPRDLYELLNEIDHGIIDGDQPMDSTGWHTDHCWVEKLAPMPAKVRGSVASFKLALNYGTVLGVISALSLPYTLVPAGVWQRKMGCLSGGDKKVTRNRARELWPKVKVTHATADALLIATYGYLSNPKAPAPADKEES